MNNSKVPWGEMRKSKGEVVGGGFIVLRRGRTTGRIKYNSLRPPFEHPSMEAAAMEAMRLADSNPGVRFGIFQQIAVADVTVEKVEQKQ